MLTNANWNEYPAYGIGKEMVLRGLFKSGLTATLFFLCLTSCGAPGQDSNQSPANEPVNKLIESAEQGDAKAQFNLGLM
jgi:hypothetical protein